MKTKTINKKLSDLTNLIKKMDRVLIAYSGGVDSTFLLATARKSIPKENILAITAISETYPASEKKQAKKLAKTIDVRHIMIETQELKNINFRNNPLERCFYCKNELFEKLAAIAKIENMTLCDATNFSDKNDFRPGRKAAIKWSVKSPLMDAGLTKSEIRTLSKEMGLPTWDQPAQACLASRFPYGMPLSEIELKKIEKAEIFLKQFDLGTFRLRHHNDIARIEVDKTKLANLINPTNNKKITSYLKKLGWRYITVDLEGYRTGSFNP